MDITLPKGTILRSADHIYRIEEVLGQGGFGITYRATEKMTVQGVPVRVIFAIKEHFLSSACDRDSATGRVSSSNASRQMVADSMKDFLAEAQRLRELGAKIDHIVKVREMFQANDTAYYVMEYLEGESLKRYVERVNPSEEDVMKLLLPLIRSVGEMHSMQMTHLDIKPDNIMISYDDDGHPLATLIDFGLSKHYNADGSPTSTINVMGTSDGYAPIEQYGGITTFSPTADIYALGATLFYCFTGHAPKKSTEMAPGEGEKAALAASARYGAALAKAMAPNKFERFQSVADFLAALNSQLAPEPAPEPTTSPATIPLNAQPSPTAKAPATPIEPTPLVQSPVPPVAVSPADKKTQMIGGTHQPSDMGGNGGNDKPSKKGKSSLVPLCILAAIVLVVILCFAFFRGCASGAIVDSDTINGSEILSWDPDTKALSYGKHEYKMITVPGGTFTMGATGALVRYADQDEMPTHSVTLSSYFIGESEVPQWLWEAVMGSNPSNWKGDNLPVENVSWNDCQNFISKLNEMTGADFRLPTEAEWEFAAREGKSNNDLLYSGSNKIDDVAWYYGNSNGCTHDVKTKRANSLGLYDMTGNVSEMCQDWKWNYSSSWQTDPAGPSSGSSRVIRGGNWDDTARYSRVSYRSIGSPSGRSNGSGLRLAM